MHYAPLYMEWMLLNRLGEDASVSWIVNTIMAIDNIFAIFLVAVFGWLSDRTKSRFGRRMPWIFFGGLVSLLLFPLIAVMFLFNSFIWFVIIVALMKLAMVAWRSPAVAIMPDITPKPLRAKANAIINFVGYIGAILGAVLAFVPAFRFSSHPDYLAYSQPLSIIPFILTAVVMLGILLILFFRFKENKVVEEMAEEMKMGEEYSETIEKVEEGKPLSKRDKKNMWILMAAIFMCWFAFNSLQTNWSRYGINVLGNGVDYGVSMAPALLAVASLIAFLPSIRLTKKIGRKKTVLIGLGIIIVSLTAAMFIDSFGILMLAIFAISGVGWAIVNVCTFPMLVEMASPKNVGKIIGIYYVASQSAQALSSVISGFVLDWVGWRWTFFPYAIIFMSIAFILCFFFKTNESRAKELQQSTPIEDVIATGEEQNTEQEKII